MYDTVFSSVLLMFVHLFKSLFISAPAEGVAGDSASYPQQREPEEICTAHPVSDVQAAQGKCSIPRNRACSCTHACTHHIEG